MPGPPQQPSEMLESAARTLIRPCAQEPFGRHVEYICTYAILNTSAHAYASERRELHRLS
jgi:hypothetical protein